MDCTTRLRSRLAVHPLEDRAVPALLISDVLADIGLGSGTQDARQYFEIRGDANATIPGRTYFVVVDGDAGASGTVNAVFDLGGAQLGSDGYLAVVTAGNPYSFIPTTAVLAGTTTGFGGLGGTNPDRFSDNSGLSNRFEFILGSNSYLLVTATTPPVPNADVDNNNDGLLDGIGSNWTVLDSVGLFSGSTAASVSYAKINFYDPALINGAAPTAPLGQTAVVVESVSHAGRVDESTGYAATDWVSGLAQVVPAGGFLRYAANIFGHPTQREFVGLRTDLLGTSNFASNVSGRVYADANGNGAFDPGEATVGGQTVWVDRNNNGLLDTYTVTVDADGLVNGTEMTNLFDRVTLSSASIFLGPVFDSNNITALNIAAGASPQPTTGTAVFSAGGNPSWSSNGGMRGDFYRPVQAVSLDAIGTTITAQIGRLEVYANDGTLLQVVTTRGLLRGDTETLTINRAAADIAYFIAYSDPAGFPFNYFDNLRFTLPEESATTAADGTYKIGLLQDGSYTVRTLSGAQLPATITNLVPVRNVDFGTGAGIGGGGGSGTGGRGRTLAVGGGPGAVSVYGTVNGQFSPASIINFPVLFPDDPFDGTYRTATGDVNGDGAEDVVVITGPGVPVKFAVIDGRTANTLLVPLTTAFNGSEDFTGGGFVAVGDLDGDGRAEIVLTPDQGGGPRVTVFSVLPVGVRIRGNYFGIADANFRGGARAALGDLNGDGRADLVVAAGFEGGPRVAVYDGRLVLSGQLSRLAADFYAFDPNLRNGVFVAVGDVDGDGVGDLVIGAGAGGGPAVRVLSGRILTTQGPTRAINAAIADFLVNGDTESRGGVRVTVKNVDGDARADVIVGSGEGAYSNVRVYPGKRVAGVAEPTPLQDIDPFGFELAAGVFVG